jgi:hypothetical protein
MEHGLPAADLIASKVLGCPVRDGVMAIVVIDAIPPVHRRAGDSRSPLEDTRASVTAGQRKGRDLSEISRHRGEVVVGLHGVAVDRFEVCCGAFFERTGDDPWVVRHAHFEVANQREMLIELLVI